MTQSLGHADSQYWPHSCVWCQVAGGACFRWNVSLIFMIIILDYLCRTGDNVSWSWHQHAPCQGRKNIITTLLPSVGFHFSRMAVCHANWRGSCYPVLHFSKSLSFIYLLYFKSQKWKSRKNESIPCDRDKLLLFWSLRLALVWDIGPLSQN